MTKHQSGSPDARQGLTVGRLMLSSAFAVLLGLATLITATPVPLSPLVLATTAGAFIIMLMICVWCLTASTPVTGQQQPTLATWITIARGWLTVLFTSVYTASLLQSVSPKTKLGWIAAGIFVFAAGLDMVDGAVARRTETETKFGSRLDTETDGLLVGLGTIGAVIDGTVPTIFLIVGGARYIFIAAAFVRRRRGLTCSELEPELRGKLNGGIVIATVWLAVMPVTSGHLSWWLAGIITPITLGYFIWDWMAFAEHR